MTAILSSLRKRAGLLKLKLAFKKLRSRFKAIPLNAGPDDLLDLVFSKDYELMQPWQNRSEIVEVLKIIGKNPPKALLEIGTANGGTLFLLSRMADENALIASVDLPGGKFGGGYAAWKQYVYKAFAKPQQTMHLLQANSHEPETFKKVKEIFGERKIEFLFIDGDHTYEGIKEDFMTYKSLLADEALVLFHDIFPHFNPIYGVEKFWKEIKPNYKHQEFIEDTQQDGKGLGLLYYTKKSGV